MNKYKEKESTSAEKDRKISRSLAGILSGNMFTHQEIVRQLPYLLFLSFLALTYIANGYLAEGTVRNINTLSNELKELRSEYITTKSDLMYRSKQSELARTIQQKGLELKESSVPPKKIVVRKSDNGLIVRAE